MTKLVDIHRHPVKGFMAEAMSSAQLTKGKGLAFDRHFAIVNGNKEDIPVPGGWVQPRTFFILTFYPALARFRCVFNEEAAHLTITAPDGEKVEASSGDPESFESVNALMRKHFEPGPHGDIRMVEQENDLGNWDFADTEISIINLATLRVISEALGRDLEYERFRGNLYVDGLEPWEEFRWPGCRLRVGDAELDITRPIQRCAMTSTEPGTGERAIDVPASMVKSFGHQFCGVYARVTRTGLAARGDTVEMAAQDVFNPHENLPERAASPALWPRFLSSADEDASYTRCFSPQKKWPLLAAQDGQAFKSHPIEAARAPYRTKISYVNSQGWYVPAPGPPGPLFSGPYGRAK